MAEQLLSVGVLVKRFELIEVHLTMRLSLAKREELLQLIPRHVDAVILEDFPHLGHVDLAGAIVVNPRENVFNLLLLVKLIPRLQVPWLRSTLAPCFEPVNRSALSQKSVDF